MITVFQDIFTKGQNSTNMSDAEALVFSKGILKMTASLVHAVTPNVRNVCWWQNAVLIFGE
jgi:hypothetical protein